MQNIIEYIAAGDPTLIIGQNLFGGDIPIDGSLDTSSAVLWRGGASHRSVLDGNIGICKIQIYTRGVDYFSALDMAVLISGIFNDQAGIDIVPYYVHAIDSINEPGYLGKDERGRYEFSQNYNVIYSIPS
jgi:hypothetical protein